VKVLLGILFISFIAVGFTQEDLQPNYDDSLITVSGRVIDTNSSVTFYNIMVINQTVGKGIFGDFDGTFSITFKKSHKIAISVTGYKTQYFSFKDKPYKKNYDIIVYVDLNEFTSAPVNIKPLKTLGELQEERSKIAKRELPEVTAINAIVSPITALYMTFSKREKTKRMIAELEFRDQQRAVVKEILRIYIHADIIELEDEEFDDFITFLNLNSNFLKTASDYELVVYIKQKFEHFRNLNENGF